MRKKFDKQQKNLENIITVIIFNSFFFCPFFNENAKKIFRKSNAKIDKFLFFLF